MDGTIADHSDSDSGESWTLLENYSTNAENTPTVLENTDFEREAVEISTEKDEDTDGISIISDCEQEPACELNYESHQYLTEPDPHNFTNQYISFTPISNNSSDHDETMKNEYDFLGDNTKHKTYVHRRNKRLSTVLNIIMLGSVITAAGVAIGHMWGAKHECPANPVPSVNKILSNLYKLQEENAYLRSKLKELTGTMNLQRKTELDKTPLKHQRCKKVYEESLNNRYAEKITKCLDDNTNNVFDILNKQALPVFEKDYLTDINKLKNVYMQNKGWLDDEIAKRLKSEKQMQQKYRKELKGAILNTVREEFETKYDKTKLHQNSKKESNILNELNNMEDISTPLPTAPVLERISYADSLKKTSNIQEDTAKPLEKLVFTNKPEVKNAKHNVDKIDEDINKAISDYEIVKDDRYIPKAKKERNKIDRHKSHKKQKRKNKYEEWEMKGGYLKDYDEVSTASKDNESLNPSFDKHTDMEKAFLQPTTINEDNFLDVEDVDKTQVNEPKNSKHKEKSKSSKELKWYEKRAAFRTEARKKLEHELFGENTNNKASWYFRRMQKREQCRVKDANSTNKKLSKRQMNYKNKK